MKSKKNILILTAATLILSLCGFFLSKTEEKLTPTFSPKSLSISSEAFSLKRAKELLKLCSVAQYPESLEALISEASYTDFTFFEREQESIYGSGIGFGFAIRESPFGGYDALLILRGTEGCEWFSNFAVGEGTLHAGFEAAADFVKEETDARLESLNIKKEEVSITLSGHSRGGAVANLAAKAYLDEKKFREVSAYTFAAPNTTLEKNADSDAYRSIFNIRNPEDFITFVPLESWGYTKYGVSIDLPSDIKGEYSEEYKKMQEIFFSKCGFPHKSYENGSKDIKALIKKLSSICPTVSDYYRKEISTPSSQVTVYEYLDKVSCVLSGERAINSGLFILSCLEASELSTVTQILTEGISLDRITESDTLTQGALYCAHICETYEAWLEALPEEYFLNMIKSS